MGRRATWQRNYASYVVFLLVFAPGALNLCSFWSSLYRRGEEVRKSFLLVKYQQVKYQQLVLKSVWCPERMLGVSKSFAVLSGSKSTDDVFRQICHVSLKCVQRQVGVYSGYKRCIRTISNTLLGLCRSILHG